MSAEDKEEIAALVVGFLTSALKEQPHGYTLPEFERYFPEKTDEARDWFKRYKLKSTLDALKAIPESVCLSNQHGLIRVQLNRRSDKLDAHLVDLITNQKPSAKRKQSSRPRASYQRCLDSFSINKRYSKPSSSHPFRARLNYNHQYNRHDNSYFDRRSPPHGSVQPRQQARPTIYNEVRSSFAPGDPRNRAMVPPQVKPSQLASHHIQNSWPSSPATSNSTTTSSKPPSIASPITSRSQQQVQAALNNSHSQSSSAPRPSQPHASKSQTTRPAVVEDPAVLVRKEHVRQRLYAMLTCKYPEIKLFYLTTMYRYEYDDELDPAEFGHKSLTTLLDDPVFRDSIQIIYKAPHITVSAKSIAKVHGKENVALGDVNRSSMFDAAGGRNDSPTDRPAPNQTSRTDYEAIDPFNVKTMLQSLEPLREVKEPPLGNNVIEETIKYRTLRIIYKEPGKTLKLDDWERRYQQEWNCQNKIQIRDYGCRNLLGFFKQMTIGLPIKIQLNNSDEWVAKTDVDQLNIWLESKMKEGKYRAITVIDAKYDQVAFPNDRYTYSELKDLPQEEYLRAVIMSVKIPHKLWLQIRTQKRIEEHLMIESALSSYDDYKRKGFFKVHPAFLKTGFPCVAFDDSQQRWCRAVILKASGDLSQTPTVTALLVDYAITKNFSTTQILCILKSHLKHPIGLIYAQLHGVSEEIQNLGAKVILQGYTNPPVTLACKIISSKRVEKCEFDGLPANCFYVSLVDTRQGTDRNLADIIKTAENNFDD